MPNLLHLSDLHFGYEKDATARAQRTEALDLLVKEVTKLKTDPAWKLDYLIISGDLAWSGQEAEYKQLKHWLTKKLYPATGLTPTNTVICAGNHDIDRKKTLALVDRTEDSKRADLLLHPDNLAAGFAPPFAAFVKFAQSFKIPAPLLNKNKNYLAGVHKTTDGLRFVIANSAWFCRGDQDRGQLWLGLPQLQTMDLLPQDEWENPSELFTIALVHHPPSWLSNADYTAYGDRPCAYGYLAARTHLILSGHTHGPVTAATEWEGRAQLFTGGATYDSAQYRNNFSVLQIDTAKRTIVRRAWELDPRTPLWEEKKPQSYKLRTRKAAAGGSKTGKTTRNPKAPADTTKYFALLREQTRSIDLNHLRIGPDETPAPAIDRLFIRLTTASRGTGKKTRNEQQDELQAMGRPQPTPLEELLKSNQQLVIEGKPGSGKTTFVRWLTWMLARPGGPPAELDWLKGVFPIWVRISQLDAFIAETATAKQRTTDPRWIARFLATRPWGLDEAFFDAKLKAPNTLLLLDGLDEAANQQRRIDIVKLILDAAGQWNCRLVVTTRPGVHEGRATLKGFETATIDDLDNAGIDNFLLQWCRWLKQEETVAQAHYAEMRPAVAVPAIRHLARNPLMLTSLAVLYFRRNKLPEQRVKLYAQILDWLADQAVEKHPELKKDSLLERFAILALAMQVSKGGQKLSIGIDDAAALLSEKNADSVAPMRQFLEQAQNDSGIITLRGPGEIAFWHRSFQEYLAARRLADTPDAKIPAIARKMLCSAEGREVLPLVAGCMAEGSKDRLALLFADLTAHALEQNSLEHKAHAAGVLGKMLSDIRPFEGALAHVRTGEAAAGYNRLTEEVVQIFEKGKTRTLGLKTRVDAAEALDQADPSRLPLPDDERYWATIPGGEYTIGGDDQAFQSLPETKVTLPESKIGRFPVTVWEYGLYLAATETKGPEDWEQQVEHPSRPVVNVTWHQAQAYCDHVNCKLATDAQWEAAARGKERRTYAWGHEEPDEHRANCNRILKEPSPVGMFPEGDTPEGVADMTGNVWEWTRSEFEPGRMSVRGAAFYSDGAVYLRAAARFWYEPGLSSDDIGFRCVRE